MARRRLCRLDEIADGAARGFAGDGADAADPGLIVIRQGRSVLGYLNICPISISPSMSWPAAS